MKPLRTLRRPHVRLALFSRRAVAAAAARHADFRHAVRVTAAVGGAYGLGLLLNLPQSYWAVFTAVIVTQTSIGGTINATLDRMIGTAVGAIAGAAAAAAKLAFDLDTALVLCTVTAVTVFAAAGRPKLKVAPITAVIVVIATPQGLGPWHAALYRLVEILVGGAVGVAATLFIFPAPARQLVSSGLTEAITQLAEVLRLYVRTLNGEALQNEIDAAHARLRGAIGKVETAMEEAKRERSSLIGASLSERPPRVLWRARNDAVTVERALAVKHHTLAFDRLRPGAVDILKAQTARLLACAQAVETQRAVARGDLAAREAAFEAVVQVARDERITVNLSAGEAADFFGLVFALRSLTANLEDLADAVDELNRPGLAALQSAVGAP